MRYLSFRELLELYEAVIAASGGGFGIRDFGLVEAALAKPRATFDGSELYPSIQEKAAALGFALVANHPFIDGNKRIGHAAMECFLMLNGYEIDASVATQERIILRLASGELTQKAFTEWVAEHTISN